MADAGQTRQEQVASVIARWREQWECGRAASPSEVISSHPDLAEDLAERFRAMDVLEDAFGGLAPDADILGERVLGEFRLVRPIGRGGMGVVYEAEQVSMRRRVALKILPASSLASRRAVKRFEREARAAGSLHHTNVVSVIGMGRDRDRWYYAMELVEGRSLREVVDDLREVQGLPAESHVQLLSGGALEERTPEPETREPSDDAFGTSSGGKRYFTLVARMIAGVADALHFAHELRIIHRDVKPGNLMLDHHGTLKLMDFGLARVEDAAPSMTVSGDIVGTPYYMSPEQARGSRSRLDHRTDIYSLGATLYELLTLRPPVEGKNIGQVYARIVSREPVSPRRIDRRIPRDLETIVLRSIQKDPRKRYASAGDMAEDLRRFADGSVIRARRIGPLEKAWRLIMRNRTVSALAAAALVLAAVGAVFAMRAARMDAERIEREYDLLMMRGEAALGRERGDLYSSREFGEFRPSPVELFGRAIELRPARPDAWFGRAWCGERPPDLALEDVEAARMRGFAARTVHLARAHFLRELRRYEEAEAAEEKARALTVGGPEDEIFEARISWEAGDSERARSLLDEALPRLPAESPLRRMAHRFRSSMREYSGDLEGAVGDLAVLRAAGDESPELLARTASIWKRLEHGERAAAIFEELLERLAGSGSVESWSNLAKACFNLGEFSWEDRATEAAVKAFPDAPLLLARRASVLFRLGRLQESLEATDAAARKIEEVTPRIRAFVAHHRAHTLQELGRTPEAEELYRNAQAEDPQEAEHHACLAKLLHGEKRHEQALAEAEAALKCDSRDRVSLEVRGLSLSALGRRVEARRHYEESLRSVPFEANLWLGYGILLGDLGELEAARDAVARAIEIGPDTARQWNELAWILLAMGEHDKGLKAADKGIEKDPGNHWGFLHRGNALLEKEEYDAALASYEEVLKRDAKNPAALANRATALKELGRWREAVKASDAALAAGARYRQVLHARAVALRRLGEVDEALQAVKELNRSYPGFVSGWQMGADLCLMTGRPFSALTLLRQSRPHVGFHPELRIQWGMAYLRTGQLREAAEMMRQVLARRPDERFIAASLPLTLAYRGRWARALEEYDRILADCPENQFAYVYRGIVLGFLGDEEESRNSFARARALVRQDAAFRQPECSAEEYLGNHERALVLARGLYRERPDADHAGVLVNALLYTGDPTGAREVAARHAQKGPGETQFLLVAYLRAVVGDAAGARRLLESFPGPWGGLESFKRARIHAWMNERKAALHWLERAHRLGQRVPRRSDSRYRATFGPLSDDPGIAKCFDRMR